MLREFQVANFYSIHHAQRSSFALPGDGGEQEGGVASKQGDSLTNCQIVLGANASGKSNYLEALTFILWFIRDSWNHDPDQSLPFSPFAFCHPLSDAAEFLLEVEHVASGSLYRYELAVTKKFVIRETLFRKQYGREWSCLFGREREENGDAQYVCHISEEIAPVTPDELLANASFLSIRRRKSDPDFEEFFDLTHYISGVSLKKQYSPRVAAVAEEQLRLLLERGQDVSDKVISLLRKAGVGLHNICLGHDSERIQTHRDMLEQLKTQIDMLEEKYDRIRQKAAHLVDPEVKKLRQELDYDVSDPRGIIGRSRMALEAGTAGLATLENDKTINVLYKIGNRTYQLPLEQESDGVKAIAFLLPSLLEALRSGSIFIFDELERSVHPLALPYIIELFTDRSINSRNAQIICTTHSVHLIREMNAYQILLVEKDDTMQTSIWRLGDMEGLEKEENYLTRYMAGAYGGIPGGRLRGAG